MIEYEYNLLLAEKITKNNQFCNLSQNVLNIWTTFDPGTRHLVYL